MNVFLPNLTFSLRSKGKLFHALTPQTLIEFWANLEFGLGRKKS